MGVQNDHVATFLTDLAMPESARWHDGRFWCSDWVAGEVLAAGLDGTVDVLANSTSFPFCFDWLPDGSMVVTATTGLERLQPGRAGEIGALVPFVDMTGLISRGWNEVVVDPRGNAFVNSPNFDMSHGFDFDVGSRSGVIAVVTPAGDARLIADGVAFPNGMAISPDGSTLIVAESFASRLSAWDIDGDGGLSNRRVWASLDNGADGKTLFMVANQWNGYENIGKGPRRGRVYTVEVDVPAAGVGHPVGRP